MRERRLGNTGIKLSVIGLGAMPLAIEGRPSEADAIRVVHAALAASMNWIDVADSYCLSDDDVGYAERLVSRALATFGSARDGILVTTKVGYVRPGGAWALDGRPARLRAACEASLKALGVSSIPLLQLHGPDPKVYYPDSVGALAELRREGKAQHIGLSNVDVGHLEDAIRIAPIASVQNRCNVFDRHSFDNGVVKFCEQHGIAFIAHSPVGGHRGRSRLASAGALHAVAERHGLSSEQVAIAWLLAKSPNLLAIPGASKTQSAESSAHMGNVSLASSDIEQLDRAFPPASGVTRRLVSLRRRVRHALRNVRARLR
jgi:aryl-alcohol dehydrogenase-like predicted oxidoreductase